MSASAPAIDPAPSPALDTITRAPPILLDSGFEDRFQIMRELGRGAMGAVFVAFDRELCREVAVKQILPASIAEPEYQQRFRREYRALAAISDPGVPQVYHSGHSSDGGAWFTMEIVRGEPLRQILSHGPLLPLRALAVAIDLGKTLAVAHAAGIIHRDVKPSNIMLEPGDRVRLLDFGVCSPTKRFLRSAEPYRRTADVDRWHDIFDLERAPEAFVDLILRDLGNPFPFELDAMGKRRLASVLVEMYRQKGTAKGIQNAIRFFLGIDISAISPFNADTLYLGESLLGVDWVLGPSDRFARYAFNVEVARILTDRERRQLRAPKPGPAIASRRASV